MAFEITVESIKAPDPGKKKAMVKTTEGRYWFVWADKMHDFQPGARVSISKYDSWTSPQGRKYNTATEYQVLSCASQAVVQGPLPTYPQRQQAVTPPPVEDDKRQLNIFVCGAFNNFMSNPNIDPREMKMVDMIDVLHKFKGAWLGVFGPSPLPRQQRQDPISTGASNGVQGGSMNHNDDMNDDIPF